MCSNCTRVYVQKSVLEAFIKSLVAATEKLNVGNPFEDDTLVGAVINESHGNKILKYIDTAVSEV